MAWICTQAFPVLSPVFSITGLSHTLSPWWWECHTQHIIDRRIDMTRIDDPSWSDALLDQQRKMMTLCMISIKSVLTTQMSSHFALLPQEHMWQYYVFWPCTRCTKAACISPVSQTRCHTLSGAAISVDRTIQSWSLLPSGYTVALKR